MQVATAVARKNTLLQLQSDRMPLVRALDHSKETFRGGIDIVRKAGSNVRCISHLCAKCPAHSSGISQLDFRRKSLKGPFKDVLRPIRRSTSVA